MFFSISCRVFKNIKSRKTPTVNVDYIAITEMSDGKGKGEIGLDTALQLPNCILPMDIKVSLDGNPNFNGVRVTNTSHDDNEPKRRFFEFDIDQGVVGLLTFRIKRYPEDYPDVLLGNI